MTYTIHSGINDIGYDDMTDDELMGLSDIDTGYDPRWESISLYEMIEDEFIINRIERERIKNNEPTDITSLIFELANIRSQSNFILENGRA